VSTPDWRADCLDDHHFPTLLRAHVPYITGRD
jgi:hypothetical protein